MRRKPTEAATGPPSAHEGGLVPPLVYRRVEPADAEALLALFRSVFGSEARDQAAWRWRFEQAPLGHQSCLAEERDTGRVVAHIGGTPHTTLWDGVPRQTVECVDHMVAPGCRGGPGTVNSFSRLQHHWIDASCGRDRSFLGWGFPSRALYRVGRRFAGYRLVRSLPVLLREDLPALEREIPGVVVQRERDLDATELDELWAQLAPELPWGLVRDGAHLRWRYGACPHRAYAPIVARDARTGVARGVGILREGGVAKDVATIMEWLVPRGDDEALAGLLAGAAAWARESGCCGLAVSGALAPHEHAALLDNGFAPRRSQLVLCARSWDPDVDLSQMRRRMRLSLGDLDGY
jgi:hypothetical protein